MLYSYSWCNTYMNRPTIAKIKYNVILQRM